jgi:hypothetical protein
MFLPMGRKPQRRWTVSTSDSSNQLILESVRQSREPIGQLRPIERERPDGFYFADSEVRYKEAAAGITYFYSFGFVPIF